jgi:hypothetical protein
MFFGRLERSRLVARSNLLTSSQEGALFRYFQDFRLPSPAPTSIAAHFLETTSIDGTRVHASWKITSRSQRAARLSPRRFDANINAPEKPLRSIIVGNRRGLRAIYLKSGFEYLGIVIAADGLAPPRVPKVQEGLKAAALMPETGTNEKVAVSGADAGTPAT